MNDLISIHATHSGTISEMLMENPYEMVSMHA